MRNSSLALFLSFTCFNQLSLVADTYRLMDGGVEREFEIDQSSLVCRPLDGMAHMISISDQKTDAGIRSEATRLESVSTPTFDLCLYEKGAAREPKNARRLVRKIRVEMLPGANAEVIAQQSGASSFETPVYAPKFVILSFPQVGDSLLKLEAVRGLDGVLRADPLMARKKFKRLIPDDPKFLYSPSNTSYQWHLNNTGQNGSIFGLDVNVTEVWDNQRGNGVTIGIVDDGLEVLHPDLAPNVNTAIDYDWNDGTPNDPTPNNTFDDHGTACAGVAAARGNNSIGVSGAAPEATLVGLRLIANDTTDQQDAEALAWRTDEIDISSNSWGESDDGRDFYVEDPLVAAAFEAGVTTGRGGKGTIYVWAAGNGRDEGDYSNYEGYNNRIETISVGAIAADGQQSYYSESGANLLVCAPSDDDFDDPGITTTTLTALGGVTDEFGGTSSATPLVSGVVAMILEKSPDLGWRDVQEILIRSARKVDSGNADWADNSAGFHFNHGYGAGMVDAAAAVALADGWKNLGEQMTQSVASGPLSLTIPDNSTRGTRHTLTVGGDELRLEHVQLTVDITHASRGNLEILLTSPSGMVSRFTEVHDDTGDNISNYTFLSTRHWGETSTGGWTVRVLDLRTGNVGQINSLELKLYGALPVVSGYTAWSEENIPAGSDRTTGADVDGDGRDNLMEYALGSNPIVSDQLLNQPVIVGDDFEFKLDVSKDDLTYKVETSTDLDSWSDVATTVLSESGDIQTRRTVAVTPLGERRSFRLKVELSAP